MNKEFLIQIFAEGSKDSLLLIVIALLYFANQFKDNFHHCMYCLIGASVVCIIRIVLKTYLSVKSKKKL